MRPGDSPVLWGWTGEVRVRPEPPPGELVLRLPFAPRWRTEQIAGCFVLVRCSVESGPPRTLDWGLYRRRALAVTGAHADAEGTELRLWLPQDEDPGHGWLAQVAPGSQLHCLGPWGRGYRLHEQTRHLLLLAHLAADPGALARLLPLVNPTLDRGGRVTVVARVADNRSGRLLQMPLPIPVEVRVAMAEAEWMGHLEETLAWADQVCGDMPMAAWGAVAETVRRVRFRLDEGFCQMRVVADVVCGTGGCLACVVSLPRGGLTRACVHGPVFDLTWFA